MAADMFLMEKSIREPSVVFVRFYTWEPAAITIGRMQRAASQLDFRALERDGISWIRRPTGGRAVLHAGDLTYSCIFNRSNTVFGDNVAATYKTITDCLRRGLMDAGIETVLQHSVSHLIKCGREVKLPCFLAPNRNEIMVNGRKLVGSAQYRTSSAILQHGSIPINKEYLKLPLYLALPQEERIRQIKLLSEKTISISRIDSAITIEKLIPAFIGGFIAVLGCISDEEGWRRDELDEIERIEKDHKFRETYITDPPV